jgi:putative flippase GtrA
VSSISELYGRFRHLIHEGGKFLVVGGVGTVVTFGLANALNGMGKYKAVTVATIVATIVTFIGNRYWTFRHREGQSNTRDTVMFFILNGVGLLIYYACFWLIQDAAGLKAKIWYNVALVVGTGLGTLFRFWSYRKWVWTAPGAPGAELGASLGGSPVDPPPEETLTAAVSAPAAPAPAPAPAAARTGGGSHRRP